MDRSQIALTWTHDPADIAAVVREHGSSLDLTELIGDYKHLRDGVRALAEDQSKSDDMEELYLLLATIDEFRNGLMDASSAANRRLHHLEIAKRHNSLSTGGATS
jgi:hypothetical protein